MKKLSIAKKPNTPFARIEDAVAELKDEDPDFNEDNLRLMRIKFLSEYAN